MRLDKYTIKAQEAIQEGQSIARRSGHPHFEAEHLARGLLDQHEGIAQAVPKRLGTDRNLISARVDEALTKLPRVEGTEGGMLSQRLVRLFDTAEDEAKSLKDEYVSSEHVLLAMTRDKGAIGEILKSSGVTHDRILAVLKDVRGSARVTSQEAEATYRALEKFGRDLTQAAKDGKLDPVIGRDEEIRRVVQVLSRRTKNNPVLIRDPSLVT